jgi:AraC family transcriptional regulator
MLSNNLQPHREQSRVYRMMLLDLPGAREMRMSTVMYRPASTATAPISTGGSSRAESLVQLLAAAKAAIESDITAARACIKQAAALLRPGLHGEPARPACAPATRGGLAPWQAKRVASYIEANLASSIRIDELAEVAQLSASHFFRVFRESFGTSPLDYIAQQRVHRAQQLMMSSREPLAQIALACGMCDQAHFTRVFRRIVGTNPRAWRRQLMHGPR